MRARIACALLCSAWELALTEPNPASNVEPLPLVRQFVSPPQVLHSSIPAVYRIQLQPTACVLSAEPPCHGALLLDSIPLNNSTNWIRIGS